MTKPEKVVLTLVLKQCWFVPTIEGKKTVEYRAMTPHWEKRIWNNRDRFTHVRFLHGYTKLSSTFRITKIDIGNCPLPGWLGEYYRIHFAP